MLQSKSVTSFNAGPIVNDIMSIHKNITLVFALSCFVFLKVSLVYAVDTPSVTAVQDVYSKMVQNINPQAWGEAQARGKIASLKQGRVLSNPEIQIGFGTTNFVNFQGKYQELSVSQTIPLNGVRSGLLNKINLQQQLSLIELKQLEFEVGREVLLQIFTHQMSKELASHLKERIARLALIENFLNKRKFASPKDIVEREQVRHRLKMLRVEVKQVETQLDKSSDYFSAYCDQECMNNLNPQWPDQEKIKTIFDEAKNSEIYKKSLQLQVSLLNEDKNMAETMWRPDLRLYGMTTYEGQPYQSAQVNRALGISLQIPLFDRGQYLREQAQAQAYQLERNQVAMERVKYQNTLMIERDFERALEILSQYNDRTEKQGEKSLDAATDGFKKGMIPVNQFIDLDEQIHTGISLMVHSRFDLVRLCLDMISENQSYRDLKGTFL